MRRNNSGALKELRKRRTAAPCRRCGANSIVDFTLPSGLVARLQAHSSQALAERAQSSAGARLVPGALLFSVDANVDNTTAQSSRVGNST